MKQIMIVSLFLLGMTAQAMATPLSGRYQVASNACGAFSTVHGAVVITATAQQFSWGVEVPYGNQTGIQTYLAAPIGTYTVNGGQDMGGGNSIQSTAKYLYSGENQTPSGFSYTVIELPSPFQNSTVVIQSLYLVKTGSQIQWEVGSSQAPCLLQQL